MKLLRLLSILFLVYAPTAFGAAVTIGYLELEDDPRYFEERMQARFQAQPWGRPYAGAEMALQEVRFPLSAVGTELNLVRESAADADELLQVLERMHGEGVRFFLLDAPGSVVARLAKATADRELLLFNVSALDDALRQKQCRGNLMHLAPSRRMLSDALAQFLTSKKWREVLVLRGPHPEDAAIADAFLQSARRYGLEIVDTREFVLGADPRQRGRNNVALLTSGTDYDVVFVADSEGEFARAVPFQTQRPRVVAGAAGLVPEAWHWSSERYGAPQLNNRFIRAADRRMTGYDWAAWMGVKAVAEALLRNPDAAFADLVEYLRSDELILDGFKGHRLSFRPWNNQLRQPILLTSPNWVIDIAPLEGFLHQTNTLDTLGYDRPESACRL